MGTRLLATLLVGLSLCIGCGGNQKKSTWDLDGAMKKGDCAAVAMKLKGLPRDAEQRGALALCAMLETGNAAVTTPNAPVSERDLEMVAKKAVDILASGNGASDAGQSAMAFLRYVETAPLPDTPAFELSTLLAALGAVGQGPVAVATKLETGSDLGQELSIVALEQLALTLNTTQGEVPPEPLIAIWNGCYSLLGGRLAVDTDYRAWRLYMSVSAIALRIWTPIETTDFGRVLMVSAIATIEMNPQISVAARCDLAAPYDRLKQVIDTNIELMGALERAVAAATGCTRGRYAPRP